MAFFMILLAHSEGFVTNCAVSFHWIHSLTDLTIDILVRIWCILKIFEAFDSLIAEL